MHHLKTKDIKSVHSRLTDQHLPLSTHQKENQSAPRKKTTSSDTQFVVSRRVMYYFVLSETFFLFIYFHFLLLCMWKQKESLYKTIRRKAVIFN